MPHGLDPRDSEGIEQCVQREMEEEEDCLSGNEEQLLVSLADNPDEDDYYIYSDSDEEEEPTELPSNFNSDDDLLNKVFDDRDDAIGAVRDHSAARGKSIVQKYRNNKGMSFICAHCHASQALG